MKNPTPEEVKGIYANCYLLFEKYKNATSDEDFEKLADGGREISRKYNCELCNKMLVETLIVIENYWEVKKC